MCPRCSELERQFGVQVGIDQSEPVPGSGVQVRLALQSIGGDSRAGAGAHAGLDRDRARRWARAISRCGWRMDRIIRARRACASASAGWRRRCATAHEPPGAGSADAGGVQAVRAGFLSHRYCRLGHGVPPGAAGGPQARVLVDTGHHYNAQNIEQIVAWLLHTGHAGRIPLQRPALCG